MKLDRHRLYLLGAGTVTFIALFASSLLPTSGRAQTAGKDGKVLFEKRCGGCHALDRDKEGPRLGGVYGREAGSVSSFEYSAALKQSKLTWTDETLDKWLEDPEKMVPANDMTFHVGSSDERRAIISYLKQNSAK